jgi:hypothetical protein
MIVLNKTYPMRRLTALIKAIVPFPAEIRDEFFKIVRILDLMPGEWVPDDLPSGTSIFVEEGFLLLTNYQDIRWRCVNVYPEGTLAGTYSEGAAEMQKDSFRVRATEPTRIYYLTREDKSRVEEIFPDYTRVSMVLQQRSSMKHHLRAALFHLPPPDRIIAVDIRFRYLLRMPLQDLTEFLFLEDDEIGKVVLAYLHEKSFPLKKQISQQHN